MKIAIAGAGAFGTALAIALSHKGPVTLWGRDEVAMSAMQRTRVNPRLPEAVPNLVQSDSSAARIGPFAATPPATAKLRCAG